ncbi:hypothetical protein GCM10022247_24670 [Allokutzneria multivorans]|uniref:Uncharacterized protein n=1 Tax=Allokutzneria multivorans TaxID=1142134 RepID=A0ABP7RVS6_9PSEU
MPAHPVQIRHALSFFRGVFPGTARPERNTSRDHLPVASSNASHGVPEIGNGMRDHDASTRRGPRAVTTGASGRAVGEGYGVAVSTDNPAARVSLPGYFVHVADSRYP